VPYERSLKPLASCSSASYLRVLCAGQRWSDDTVVPVQILAPIRRCVA
jgi:hypothetical protein